MMFICFGESIGFPFQKLPAFEVIRTKAKGNSNNVFGYGTLFLKITLFQRNVRICGVLNSKFLEVFNSNT